MTRGSNKTTCRLTFLLKPEPCEEGRMPRGQEVKAYWLKSQDLVSSSVTVSPPKTSP
ncbi:hypothetical protein TorRG33x02_255440 [Trema orientale]|uniref:Uncharacterized protein n=1 Tax=Trema orientale TaxID=63057 RepID=A0A2P5DCM3_TREOI|nr:hypothetical protein TorRG33x02_255440 [Trema orientale]